MTVQDEVRYVVGQDSNDHRSPQGAAPVGEVVVPAAEVPAGLSALCGSETELV